MGEALKKVKDLIQQEHWTKDASSFTQKSLSELDTILSGLSDVEQTELVDYAQSLVQSNKNSLHALYTLGIIGISKSFLEDTYMLRLINVFSDTSKWDMVETLCKRLLSHTSNLNALHKLGQAYENTNKEKELVETWEKIEQIDFENAEVSYNIAKYKTEHKDAGARKQYKKAIIRYLLRKDFTHINKIWKLLLADSVKDYDFYFSFERKTERTLSKERSLELLISFLEAVEKSAKENYDIKITILKRILKLDPDSLRHREVLVNTYRDKYKSNPKIEDFIQMSNLIQAWRNIHEAISDFEKHISFFPGSFVYHNKWDIGRIKETTHQHLVIDFAKKRDHQMEISMAVSSLEVLPKSHFWVLRSVLPKEKLKEKITKEPLWGLKCIISSLGSADLKTIKSELVPNILTAGEWVSWSNKAKKLLTTSSAFGVLPEKADHYIFSDTPVSEIDKFYDLFRKEEKFVKKVKFIRKALENGTFSKGEAEMEVLSQVFEYFNSFLKKTETENEKNVEDTQYIHSLFLCNDILQNLTLSAKTPEKDFETEILNMDESDLKSVIQCLQIKEYKDFLFLYILEHKENWKELFQALTPFHFTPLIIETLEKAKEEDFLQTLYLGLEQNLQDNKEAFIWFTIGQSGKKWFSNIDQFKLSSNLLRVGAILYRDVQNKHHVPANKRLLLQIEGFLIQNDRIFSLFQELNFDEVKYLYSLFSQLGELMPNHTLKIRSIVEKRFPDFLFQDKFDVEESASDTSFFALSQSYKKKQQESQHLYEVEVPANSKEIEKARAFGDLKENAEYKAALEHQEALNNKAATLKDELEHAKIFDKSMISKDSVSFATTVKVLDKNTNENKVYTLLGPWESDPDKNIISYLSPIGQKLYRRKKDELCEFTINNVNYALEIISIEPVNIDSIV